MAEGEMVESSACLVAPVQTVPQGCKRTEWGVIADEWQVRIFGSLYAEPSRNGIYKAADSRGRGTRIVKMGEMFGYDFISDQEMSRVALTPRELSTSGLQDGDLLFGRRSIVPEGAGKCSLVVSPLEPITFESSIIRVRLDKTVAYPLFYYYFFASQVGRSIMSTIVSGTNVKGIRATELGQLTIPLPSFPEQHSIAEALSDVDELLKALDALIAKKRAIKKAAMQQLLTGRTRLPGFSGAWEEKSLDEIGEIAGAGVDKNIRTDEVPVRLLNYLDVYHKTFVRSVDLYQEVTAPASKAQQCAIEKGDVFFTPTSEVPDDIGHSAVSVEDIPDGVYSYHLVRLRLDADWDLIFRGYAFDTKEFLDQASRACEGSGTRYVVNLPEFRELRVQIPGDRAEQAAIGTVLADMDAEIAALERRRHKTKQIKQGMMQQLLTGRVRLVEPTPEETAA